MKSEQPDILLPPSLKSGFAVQRGRTPLLQDKRKCSLETYVIVVGNVTLYIRIQNIDPAFSSIFHLHRLPVSC